MPKDSGNLSGDAAKRLKEWDRFVETIHFADGEKITDFERVSLTVK
ncbi:MAG: hypothetical protein LBG12_10330 [Synergistaceae bacterium]|nr:hypothetical protein [Synergistaceae bacterium]